MTEPTIQDQLELEKRMVAYGISRYRHAVQAAETNERTADTDYAQKLMQGFITPVALEIQRFCDGKEPGRYRKYKTLMQVVDPYQAAYMALRATFNHFMKDEPLAGLAVKIGQMIEDEAKFTRFSKEHGEYYNTLIDDFKRKGTKSYRHMHRVLTAKARQKNVSWHSWTVQEKAAVGLKLVDCILASTDLIEKKMVATGKRKRAAQAVIAPTLSCLAWINKYSELAEILKPDRLPCVIQPDEWVAFDQGGYFSPAVRSRTPLVKTKSKQHAKMFNGDISTITTAVNALQNVPWKINQELYTHLKAAWDANLPLGLPQAEPYIIPTSPVSRDIKKPDMTEAQKQALDDWKQEARIIHTMEKERVSKCFQVIRVLRLAHEFRTYDRFWYVYQCDFRGRMYATVSGLSPQGADYAKALLQFSNGKVLGERGLYWLRVHGANCYGKDKLAYADRVQWVLDHEDLILQIANSPLDCKNAWATCDKPWQFLAFCLEYARYKREGTGMLSYLPIGLDGSCNGLQNFSAMLRDEVGGKATNLIPSDKPEDIYGAVAKVLTEKLLLDTSPEGLRWASYAKLQPGGYLPRGLAKKPVMTLPYGSTRQSCRESIYKYIVEETGDYFSKAERFHLSMYLTPLLWQSIAEVVIAARSAMDWIQNAAGQISKAGHPIVWFTPLGFPVIQDRKKFVSKQIHTELAGHFRLRLQVDTDKLDTVLQKQGSSPNFVHSMDACHLMLTLHEGLEAGLTDFACIHDDYGTHAADTDILHTCIRRAFLKLYGDNDPLWEFKDLHETMYGIKLPSLPPKGTLDLNQIMQAEYFFG